MSYREVAPAKLRTGRSRHHATQAFEFRTKSGW